MMSFIFLQDNKVFSVKNEEITTLIDLTTLKAFSGTQPFLDIAPKNNNTIYIFQRKTIISFNLGSQKETVIYDLPHTTDSGYIRRGAMRGAQLYFSVSKDHQIHINRLTSKLEAVHYMTLLCEDLLLPPDPEHGCEYPDDQEDVNINVEPSDFSFDNSGNMYVSNKYGYWRIPEASLNNVQGTPERIHLNYKQDSKCLVARDSNTLYCLSSSDSHPGHAPQFPYDVIRRIDLLPPPTSDEVVFSNQLFSEFNTEVSSFKLLSGFQAEDYRSRSEIRWVQRSLNIVFPPTPLLQTDGIFGNTTRSALAAFQKYWLPSSKADGVSGPKTRAKLIQVLKSQLSD